MYQTQKLSVFMEYVNWMPHFSCSSVIIWIILLCVTHVIKPHAVGSSDTGSSFQTDNSEALRVTFVLTEESPIGSKIGNVLLSLYNVHNSKRPDSTGPTQLLELKSNRYLALNGTSGDLFVQSRIDRESLCRDMGTCCTSGIHSMDDTKSSRPQFQTVQNSKLPEPVFLNCFLRMLVILNPNSEQFIEVIVYIVDVNDNPPRWSLSVLELEIPEHVPIGSLFKLPEATDPDQGPTNTVVAYRLYPATYNPQTSQVRCIQCPPDHQSLTAYNLPVSPQQNRYFFSLDSQTIDNTIPYGTKFNLNLRVDGDLDREKQAVHYLILLATDGLDEYEQRPEWSFPLGLNGISSGKSALYTRHTGTLTIKVTVLDTNDHAPVFVDSKPTVTVAENIVPGTIIYQAVGQDADAVDRNSLIYRISTSASTEVHRCFGINQSTGEVFIKNRLYFQNASVLPDTDYKTDLHYPGQLPNMGYLIPLQVSDRLHQAEATLVVQLTQVNTQPPKITISSHLRMSTSGDQIWITEDTPTDSIVAMINVLDPDKPLTSGRDRDLMSTGDSRTSGRTQCFTNHDYFLIRPLMKNTATEFKLILRKSLDRETLDSHVLRIECWDAGSPPLSAELRLFVRVEDIDDSPPQFDRPVNVISVKEGLAPHTLITRLQATDADLGNNARIAYRIVSQVYTQKQDGLLRSDSAILVSPDKPLVSIDKNTGEIFNEMILDREALAVINCTVEAYSPESEFDVKPRQPFKSHTILVIHIEDVNDCAPQFNETSYEFTILEGRQPHYEIGRVYAIDQDAESPNNLVRYSMRPIPGPIGQTAKMYVTVSSEGVIYTQQNQLDREQTPVLSFEIVATDNGRPSMSAFANVLIRVLDANDNSPIWLFPKQFGSRTTVNISKQATVGFQLAQLKAIDLDEGVNGEIIYSIVHGNEEGYFEVDSLNGALYLAKSLHQFIDHANRSTSSDGNQSVANKGRISGAKLHNHGKVDSLIGTNRPYYQHRLVLKASDRGEPQRFNTTVLDILIFAGESVGVHGSSEIGVRGDRGQQGANFAYDFGRILDQDLVIMVVLIALTSVISIILILAICLIRCRQLTGARQVQRGALCTRNSNQTVIKKPASNGNRTWWNTPLSFIHRNKNQQSADANDACTKDSTQDLYVLSSTMFDDEVRQSDQLHELTGRNTPGTEPYFAICPSTWNSRTGTKTSCLATRQTDHYRTLNDTPDKMSNTYVVELNPNVFDQPYALIKPQPCTSSTQENVHYQTLFSDELQCNNHQTHITSCPVNRSHRPEFALRTGSKTTDLELQPVETGSLLYSRLTPTDQRSPCKTCDRQTLQTFKCPKPLAHKTPDSDPDELEC